MGKVRIGLVKRTARKLMSLYPNLFTIDFQQNKELVSKLTKISSKKLRNQIAGYITHLVKIQLKTQTQNTEGGQ